MDKKIPVIDISTRRVEELRQQKVLVAIDSWPAHSAHPLGHFVRVLGAVDDKAVETQALLHEFNVSTASFSAEVMACLPPATWRITEDVVRQRTDLRHLPICSIDPPGCKDIDDALHCITLDNGHYQVGVHIADVTYFVHPDSPIDKEAAHRSTSTYLVERRLDMYTHIYNAVNLNVYIVSFAIF
jgi:exosome complex exonuclease DIS3/RRP44